MAELTISAAGKDFAAMSDARLLAELVNAAQELGEVSAVNDGDVDDAVYHRTVHTLQTLVLARMGRGQELNHRDGGRDTAPVARSRRA